MNVSRCSAGSTRYCALPPKRAKGRASRHSKFPDHIHEETVAAIAHVREFIRVIGEIIASADLHVIADVAIAAEQKPQSTVGGFADGQAAQLDRGV